MSIKLKTEAGVLEFIVKNMKAKDSFFLTSILSVFGMINILAVYRLISFVV